MGLLLLRSMIPNDGAWGRIPMLVLFFFFLLYVLVCYLPYICWWFCDLVVGFVALMSQRASIGFFGGIYLRAPFFLSFAFVVPFYSAFLQAHQRNTSWLGLVGLSNSLMRYMARNLYYRDHGPRGRASGVGVGFRF